ncbi:MAG: class I SAM-dependent methyltransferase [Clostridiales bacterium]|nr:class I SAM-dependent methyltransferase [Clostridiales bacterium]
MFEWNVDAIRYRIDAAEEVGFDALIASHIIPHIGQNDRVCDAGAGLGFVSFALAPHCAHVTAVEQDAVAFDVLCYLAKRRGFENVLPQRDDLFAMQPETPYDAMVFCFFGKVEETLFAVKNQCSGKAFLIKRAHGGRRFSIAEASHTRLSFQDAAAELKKRRIPFETETFTVDMGQPFSTLQDAQRFFRIYGEKGLNYTGQEVMNRLTKTGSGRFPYYLPSVRPLGMIILDAKDIPDTYNVNGKTESNQTRLKKGGRASE